MIAFRSCFLISSLLSAMAGQVFAAESFTLKKAASAMLEYEPELNAAEYDTLSAIGERQIARSELMPQVSIDSNAGFSKRDRTTDGIASSGEGLLQREIGISLSQLLYDGGFAKNHLKSAQNAHIARQISEKALIEQRVVDLTEVYLEVLRTRKQIHLAERNVRNHSSMRDMLRERAKADGIRAHVGLVQGRLQLALNTLSSHRVAMKLAEARFERLVGVTPGTLSAPKIPGMAGSINAVDLSGNFEYLAATEALEAAEHRYQAANSRKSPKVYFESGLSHGVDTNGIRGEDSEVSALVVGSWDIFNGGRNKGYECREHYQVGKFEELVRAADLQRRYNLKIHWQERLGAQNSIDALGSYAEELDQVTSDYEEQFRLGHQQLLSILDIQQEYYSANSSLVDARFEKDQSTYRIMGVQGKLTCHVLGNSGADKYCKTPVGSDSCSPDSRVPVTQSCLMGGKFDGNGPIMENCTSNHQTYYVEKPQLPVTCIEEENCSGKTEKKLFKNFKLFKKRSDS